MPEMIIIEPTVNAAERVLRVAAYCRVSSDSDDQLNSYANQVGYYTKLISDNKNWELVDIYADEGLTGTRADTRPEFQRLLKDCRKGKIDKVLTKAISRTFRNMKDCLTSIRELKSLGVEVFFEKEQLDTGSITSEMLLSFLAPWRRMNPCPYPATCAGAISAGCKAVSLSPAAPHMDIALLTVAC